MAAGRERTDMIGVLGGMGPLATADFIRKLVELTPAAREADHIPLIVWSRPDIPDRVAPIVAGGGISPLPMLCEGARFLQDAGAKCLAMPCNTAHYWYDDIVRAAGVPCIHIADAVLGELERRVLPPGRLGLIATVATQRAGFYQERLEPGGFSCLLPDARDMSEAVLPAIALVKKNKIGEAEMLFRRAIENLLAKGAQAAILACSEVPLAIRDDDGALASRCVDANEALARACVAWALERRRAGSSQALKSSPQSR